MTTYIHTPTINPAAPTVLLLPGVNTGAWFFENSLAYLLPHFNVLRMNNPGVDGMPRDNVHSVRDMARATLSIMDDLNLGQVHVVGHSMGGFHAQELALMAPTRIRRMVLMSTGYGQPHTAKDVMVLAKKSGKSWEQFNKAINKDPYEALKIIFGERFVTENEPAYRHFIQQRNTYHPGKQTSILHLTMGGTFSSFGRLHKLTTPTLVIQGLEDPLITPDHAQNTAKQIKNAHIWLQEGVGHFPTLEEPTTFPRIVDFFLGNTVGTAVTPAVSHTLQDSFSWMGEKMRGLFTHG